MLQHILHIYMGVITYFTHRCMHIGLYQAPVPSQGSGFFPTCSEPAVPPAPTASLGPLPWPLPCRDNLITKGYCSPSGHAARQTDVSELSKKKNMLTKSMPVVCNHGHLQLHEVGGKKCKKVENHCSITCCFH